VSRQPDYIRKKYRPIQDKSLHSALSRLIKTQFPRIGGPLICRLCADLILRAIDSHLKPRERVGHGQVVWAAVALDDPPRRHQRIADTRLVPVVPDLSTPEDIQARIERRSPRARLRTRAVRLCTQAYAQKALLSNCDLAELLGTHDSAVAKELVAHERSTKRPVPRRANLHDVGTGVTHKRIICWKHYALGKAPDLIARETYHSLEAVDRYLSQFDRVRHCRQLGMDPDKIAFTLACTRRLVDEYIQIDNELNKNTSHA
jgi:hypothetical protein